jgi:hypothetical protein
MEVFNSDEDPSGNGILTVQEIFDRINKRMNVVTGSSFKVCAYGNDLDLSGCKTAYHNNNNNSICIGGLMDLDLKKEIRKKIVHAVRGSGIAMNTDYEHTCPRNFNGNDDNNIVQRIGTNSLQTEQSEEARKCYGIDIADAVADAIGPIIQV